MHQPWTVHLTYQTDLACRINLTLTTRSSPYTSITPSSARRTPILQTWTPGAASQPTKRKTASTKVYLRESSLCHQGHTGLISSRLPRAILNGHQILRHSIRLRNTVLVSVCIVHLIWSSRWIRGPQIWSRYVLINGDFFFTSVRRCGKFDCHCWIGFIILNRTGY